MDIYIYIYIYSLLAIPYLLFPIGYSYAYSHLPMHMQWAAPMFRPHVRGPRGRPSEWPWGPQRAQHMGGGHGRGPLHVHRQMRIGIGMANRE